MPQPHRLQILEKQSALSESLVLAKEAPGLRPSPESLGAIPSSLRSRTALLAELPYALR